MKEKTITVKLTPTEGRVIDLLNDIKKEYGKGTFALDIIVLNAKPIPSVDIFLTEEEFIENANEELTELKDNDINVTKEICKALNSFGFIPRAGLLSGKCKITPYPMTIKKAIDEKDNTLVEKILERKEMIYDAQSKNLLTCKGDLKKIGIIDITKFHLGIDNACRGWRPMYLFSQIREFKKIFFNVALKAIKGASYYANILSDFETLIKSTSIKERTIQKFLEKNYWIFGTEYVDVKPQKALSHEYKVDFLLQRFDNNWEVVELELPTDMIFTRKLNVTAKVTNAIGQIQNAQGFISKSYEFLKSREKIEVYKPRGTLIIGNKLNDKEKERMEIINKSYGDITIIPYDDLLYKAKKQAEMIEKIFKN